MGIERKQFPLRMSEDLYRAFERWAADEFRSVNAQIEAVLSEAAKKSGTVSYTHLRAHETREDLVCRLLL